MKKNHIIKTDTLKNSRDFLEEIFQDLVRNNREKDASIFDEYIQLITATPLHELYQDPKFAHLKNHGITTEELIAQSEANVKKLQKPSK